MPSSQLETFDDIILGGGKGGKSLAMSLASAGHKVALIERGQIGGTCINVACIPTKSLVASAKLIAQLSHAKTFGVDADPARSSLRGVIERKRGIVKGMVDTHWNLFTTTPNMELILGTGKFVSPKEIEVSLADGGSRLLTAERIYVNTGSRTTIPNIPGLSEVAYLTSTSVMELDVLPEHLAIIGGGYIALEFAQIFCRLGSKVTVILRGDRFLPREDEDIAAEIKQMLEDDGIVFKSNAKTQSVAKTPNGIAISLGDNTSLECSHLLLAIGRTPNTEELNLAAAGIKTDTHGNIEVNSSLQTNVPNIWAMGDCNGGPLFTHVSWDDYRIIRDNVLHNANRTTLDRLVPYTLFIDPELGRVGMTEEQARQKGLNIVVAKIPASKVPRSITSGEPKGILKAVIDKDSKRILGCSLLCHSAGEVMSVVQMAMIGQLPYTTVRDTIFTHPTMSESLNILLATV
jgi:pyruvate/2-oxoglutarate dehydrogenase complex dihydrolipoamide dehydrogenase (E3) component